MKSRYEYADKVWHPELNTSFKGFLDKEKIKELYLGEDDIYFTITSEYRYRPDLISYNFYGNTGLDWLLTTVNDINNSPEGYEIGKEIRIPYIGRVVDLL